jgi:hypothetical protein
MRLLISKIAVLFGIVFLLSACIKKKQFDIVPALTYESYQVFSHSDGNKSIADSAYLTFSFQDGDGDLGSSDSSKLSLNLKYYEDQGSGFVYLSQFDRSIYIPKLTPKGNDKGIEGTFVQIIKPAPIFNIFTPYPYQWRISIVDQAGHESNVIETPSQSK